MKRIEIQGTIETESNDWMQEFFNWVLSRGEVFGGGIHEQGSDVQYRGITDSVKFMHWTEKFNCKYDDPVDGEPNACPKCGSKNIGRTMEVISLYRSPLMCKDCFHRFGGNFPTPFFGKTGGSNVEG